MDQRSSRNEMFWGPEGQERLASAHVILFGLGGVGSYVAECLARSGVGELTLVDSDTVSVSNINRQLEALTSTVGKSKAEAIAVVAIYTSGGKSYHALVRVNCTTKEDFDIQRQRYITRLAALGADPAAITAVRLTRLPGCLRYGSGDGQHHKPYLDAAGQPAPRMQQLLYLNPAADGRSILHLASCQTPRNK